MADVLIVRIILNSIMKITKITEIKLTIYFYDGIKKYRHYKNSNGFEWWREYKDGNEIHFKDCNGYESWSYDNPDNPDNPENKVELLKEEDIKPFEFN